jgi:uncharacterized protein
MPLILKPTYFYNLYSPSTCELRLYLNQKGTESAPPSPFQEILFRLGQLHEKNHLATFPSFSDLTGAPVEKTLNEIQKGSSVIYQGELVSQIIINKQPIKVVGIPDFIIKEGNRYLIRDCKIARHVTEDRHIEIRRQLQVYGLLFEKAAGFMPLKLEVFTGDCNIDSFDYEGEDKAISYLMLLIDIISLPDEPYSPVGWTKCGGCGYNAYCRSRAQKNEDVALVYDLDQGLARRLHESGVYTIQNLVSEYDENRLSELKRPWGTREQKVGKKARGILLQAQAMLDRKERVLQKPELPIALNYVMLDLEGLPPQLDELDKIYLWGMQVFGEKPGLFRPVLAEIGKDGDRKGWETFLKISGDIIRGYGDIPFVHWHHYERTKIKTYIERYGDIDGIAEKILSLLVDLLPITRNAVVIPEMSYSLKVVEKYVGFKRTQDEYGGDWSIAKYIEAVETDDEGKRKSLMDEILKYNEEDLKATWAVFEWLRSLI